MIDLQLEENFSFVFMIIKEALSQREKVGYGVRWPLPQLEVHTEKNIKQFTSLLEKQINVKKIVLKDGPFKVVLDQNITSELEREGYLREVVRRIQDLRKKSGLQVTDRISLNIASGYDLSIFEKELKSKVGAEKLFFNGKALPTSSIEKIRGKTFEISLQKI